MVDDIESILRLIAGDFRCGATAAGNERFAALTQNLTGAMGSAGGEVDTIVQLLRGALQMHERGDYIALADVLEFELLPELNRISA